MLQGPSWLTRRRHGSSAVPPACREGGRVLLLSFAGGWRSPAVQLDGRPARREASSSPFCWTRAPEATFTRTVDHFCTWSLWIQLSCQHIHKNYDGRRSCRPGARRRDVTGFPRPVLGATSREPRATIRETRSGRHDPGATIRERPIAAAFGPKYKGSRDQVGGGVIVCAGPFLSASTASLNASPRSL